MDRRRKMDNDVMGAGIGLVVTAIFVLLLIIL